MSIAATYVDVDSFTVATDRTDEFNVGRRVRCDCGVDGYKIGTIESASYSNPNTTVNLTSGSDDLTANLDAVDYGIVFESIPEHDHTGVEGEGGYVEPRDNILINQDFSIWQENTTFTNPANAVYTADGYYIESGAGGGTLPTINVKKNTTIHEDAFDQSCELEITNVGASGTTRYWIVKQNVEDFIKYRGKTVTVSIRLKASTAITIPGKIDIYDGVTLSEIAITSVTTSGVTYSASITVDDAATVLSVRLFLINGTGAISTTGSIYIQYMKLELGSATTPLIPRRTCDELRLCQRYYQKSYLQSVFPGASWPVGTEFFLVTNLVNGTYSVWNTVKFPVPMKAAPTITLYNDAGTSGYVDMASGTFSGTVLNISETGFTVYATDSVAGQTKQLSFSWVAVSRV
jgi:hypothetical protein